MTHFMPFGVQFCHGLEDRGVETVFGVPGVHNQELYRGLTSTGIRHVLVRHEQGACFMADGYARATRRPGVAFVITGPGLTNAMTAIGQSYSDSVPVLVVATCLDRDSLQGSGHLHQLKDQEGAGACVADWCLTAETPADAYRLIDRAFDEFESRRRRPKIVNLPIGLLSQLGPEPPTYSRQMERLQPSDKDVRTAAEIIRQSRRPLFLFGGGSVEASCAARKLVRQVKAATFSTYAGRGIVEPSWPLDFGSCLARPESVPIIASADLVLAVGTEVSEVDLWRETLGNTCKMLRVDIDEQALDRTDSDTVPIPGDANRFLCKLLTALEGQDFEPGWSEAEVSEGIARMHASVESERPGISSVVKAVDDCLPNGTQVFSDMTQFAYVAKEVVTMKEPGCWHHPYGFGTLGYALPAGIGARCARPDRPVVVIAGDYGFQYTLQELGTAAELEAPLPILVWDNECLQEISDSMVRAQISPTAVSLRNPNFSRLADAYGLPSRAPETLEELRVAIGDALKSPNPVLIHMKAERLLNSGMA